MKRLPKVDGGGVDLGVGRDVGDGGEEEVHLAGVVGLVDGGPVEPGWQLNRLYKSSKKLPKMAKNIAPKNLPKSEMSIEFGPWTAGCRRRRRLC